MYTFKNRNYLPYMSKGRWYEFFVESDGTNYKLTKADLNDCKISNNSLILPKDFHILTFTQDIHAIGDSTFMPELPLFSDNTQGFVLPDATSFDYMTIYLYCRKA